MPTLSFLNVVEGDKSLFFEDEIPEKRKELADRILTLLQSGYALFLIHGQEAWRVRGYDPDANEWILGSSRIATPAIEISGSRGEAAPNTSEVSPPLRRRNASYGRPRRSARGTEVGAVAPTAGG